MTLRARSHRSLYAHPARQLCLLVLGALLAAQLAVGWFAWALGEQLLLREREHKARLVGTSLTAKITRLVAGGASLAQADAVAAMFSETLARNADIAFVVLTDANGKVLQRAGHGGEVIAPEQYSSLPTEIVQRDVSYGHLHVGVERHAAQLRGASLMRDFGPIVLASLVTAFELAWFSITLHFRAPLRELVDRMIRMAAGDFRYRVAAGTGHVLANAINAAADRINTAFADAARIASTPGLRGGAEPAMRRLRASYRFAEPGSAPAPKSARLVAVRVLTLMLMAADLLSRPLLPLYASAMAGPGAALPDLVRASLPLSVFFLAGALAMPFAWRWTGRVGRRSSYVAGALLVVCGLVGTGLSTEYPMLLLARALTGVGYAVMLMACHAHVADSAGNNNNRGMAMMASAAMGAELCAPALGGLLAERFGTGTVFAAGALAGLTALVLGGAMLDNRPARRPKAAGVSPAASAWDRGLLGLALMSAVPARFVHAAFLVCLVPLLLFDMGQTTAGIGRAMAMSGLAGWLLVPALGPRLRRADTQGLAACGGAAVAALGLLPLAFYPGTPTAIVGIALVGLGLAVSMAAQIALLHGAPGEGPAPAAWHAAGALAAAAGPVTAGLMATAWGMRTALLMLALMSLCGALLCATAARTRPAAPTEGLAPPTGRHRRTRRRT